jgi:aldehyde:ferredoxin oxidoreductase
MDVMREWPSMVRNYYRGMGWDEFTGQPRPETLEDLGLGELVKDL